MRWGGWIENCFVWKCWERCLWRFLNFSVGTRIFFYIEKSSNVLHSGLHFAINMGNSLADVSKVIHCRYEKFYADGIWQCYKSAIVLLGSVFRSSLTYGSGSESWRQDLIIPGSKS
jgi:hypothetical protein